MKPSRCHPDQELLSAALDDELSESHARTVSEHLEQCVRCRAAQRALASVRDRLAARARPPCSPPALISKLEALELHAGAGRRQRRVAVTAAAGAVVAIVAIVAAAVRHSPRDNALDPPQLMSAIAHDHLEYARSSQPAEHVTEDAEALRQWFIGRLSFAPRLPELAPARLLGGRMCSLMGRRVALAFYEHNGERVSLYVIPATDDVAASAIAHKLGGHGCGPSARGIHACAWAEGEQAYVVVSNLATPELQRLCQRR